MNKEFIPYKQALELKELGFNEKCYGHYDSIGELNTIEDYARLGANISEMLSKEFNSVSYMKEMCAAPLYQQVFRWFREKHSLDYEITYAGKKGEYHAFVDEYIYGNNGSSPSIFSYEEAELACLKKLIIIVERKPEAYS